MLATAARTITELPRKLWRKLNRDYLRPAGFGAWRPLVPETEFSAEVRRAFDCLLQREPAAELGDYLEFGVARGTSLACVYHVLEAMRLQQVRLIGFDSFQGLPPEAAAEGGWQPGQFHSTLQAARRYLTQHGVTLARVELVKGWFDDTLTPKTIRELNIAKASLLMFDCDTYASTVRALEFGLPLIHKQAVVIFDDWGNRERKQMIGQRQAFQELVEAGGQFAAEPLPGYNENSRIFRLTRV